MPKLNMAYQARRIAILTLMCSAGWILGTSQIASAVDADVRAGVYVESDAVGVGAGLLAPVGTRTHWFFNPNVEVGFGDEHNVYTMNGDFHYDFTRSTGVTAWMGAGPAVLVTDPSAGDSRADLGLNVLTGLSGTSGNVRPFAQLKGVVSDENQVVLQGGIRF